MIRSSGESLADDVTLKAREFSQKSKILRGRQIVWMMIDFFLSHTALCKNSAPGRTSKRGNGRATTS